MPRTRLPTWGLLDPSAILNGNEAPSLLGRIVEDIDYPFFRYVPERPQDILQSLPEPMQVVDSDVETFLSANRSQEVQMRLSQVFGISVSGNQEQARQMKTKTVITRMLKQHTQVFDALMTKHEDEVLELLSNSTKKRGYMIVGLKTCVDAVIESFDQNGNQTGGSLVIPVSAVAAGFGAPLPEPVGDIVNPTISINRQNFQTVLSRFVATGERIFSLQVREVKYHGLFNRKAQIGAPFGFPFSRATFGATGSSSQGISAEQEVQVETRSDGKNIGSAELTKNEKSDDSEKIIFANFRE